MSSNGPPCDSGSSLSGGAIATIVVAVFAVLILIGALIITHCVIKLGEITIFN